MPSTSQLINEVNVLIDDELPSAEILPWLNDALSDLGTAVQATFPRLTNTSGESPVIPEKYHDALKLYAASMAKAKDMAVGASQLFMDQYFERKKNFVAYYQVPAEYKDSTDGTYPDGVIVNPYSWWSW